MPTPARMSYLHTAARRAEPIDPEPLDPNPIGDPFRMFVISDTHVYAQVDGDPDAEGAKRELDGRYYYASGQKLQDFVAQVNTAQPHLVLHIGDVTDTSHPGDFALFNSIWDDIDPEIPTYVIPGNHDAYRGYQVMVDGLGVDSRSEVAGSKFNLSVGLSANGVNVRLILVDTNMDENGDLLATSNAMLWSGLRDWIASEIESSTEEKVILALHHGPHSRLFESRYFISADAEWYRGLIQAELAAKPARQIITLFGHSHPFETVLFQSPTVHPGVNIPGALLWEEAHFTEINLYAGSSYLEPIDHVISYPYPSEE